jgi:hypothetical protein
MFEFVLVIVSTHSFGRAILLNSKLAILAFTAAVNHASLFTGLKRSGKIRLLTTPTMSPTANFVTSDPTAITSPPISCPGTYLNM